MEEKKRLGDLLVTDTLISTTDLETALRLQVGGNRRLGYLLIKMGLITEEQLHGVLTKQLDLPIAAIANDFSDEVSGLIPRYLCNTYNVIPLSFGEHNTINLAMVDPSDNEAVNDIEKYTGKVVRAFLAPQSEIQAGIRRHIPWTLKDLYNPQTTSKFTTGLAILALLLISTVAYQFYSDRQLAQYGTITQKDKSTLYENHDLIIGFTNEGKISLLGHGAHSQGYYSITFDSEEALTTFVQRKQNDLSTKQRNWVNWVMKNR